MYRYSAYRRLAKGESGRLSGTVPTSTVPKEHDEIGRIVVPTTPLRIHGADPVETLPSPKLGQHNREIYGDWLGLSPAEIAALEQDRVI
jgi:crotonobetainyl-CoA:carnitine CoA-transferase CaiB-like acyl-CoA transferase